MELCDDRRAVERAQIARAASAEVQSLLRAATDDADLKVAFSGPGDDRPVVLPRAAVVLLGEVLESLADGRAPSVVPFARELSTGEVAGLLGVSRQYAVRLLDDGRLPYRRVGNRRRVALSDALAYLRADDRRRVEALRGLAEASLS